MKKYLTVLITLAVMQSVFMFGAFSLTTIRVNAAADGNSDTINLKNFDFDTSVSGSKWKYSNDTKRFDIQANVTITGSLSDCPRLIFSINPDATITWRASVQGDISGGLIQLDCNDGGTFKVMFKSRIRNAANDGNAIDIMAGSNGNIVFEGDPTLHASCGIYNKGMGTTVNGDFTVDGGNYQTVGIFSDGGSINAVGNITVKGTVIGDVFGIHADNSTVNITGNIQVENNKNGDSCGVVAESGSNVTVNGTISVRESAYGHYILIRGATLSDDKNYMQNGGVDEDEYFKYEANGCVVKIKIPPTPIPIYNTNDIAVINAIIDNNGLEMRKANPANGSYVPEDWKGIVWSDDVADRRIIELDFNSKNISGALDVSGLTALTVLEVFDNELTELDISGCSALTKINCNYNELTELDVSGCPALTNLSCNANELTELDISACPALKGLSCSDNELTELDISGCPALKSLSCEYNELTELDVSGCPALTHLYCENNKLTELDVSGCPALTVLNCSDNALTELDVSRLTALNQLYCSGNTLTELNISGCSALKYLNCSDNELTELGVSDCPEMELLLCNNNQLVELNLTELNELLYYDYEYEFLCYDASGQMLTIPVVLNSEGKYEVMITLNNPDFAEMGISYENGILTIDDLISTSDFTVQTNKELFTLSGTIVFDLALYTVTFNGNGGIPSETSRTVGGGDVIGKMPTATREDHSLSGWFMEADGGTQISEKTIINGNMTFYAGWTADSKPQPISESMVTTPKTGDINNTSLLLWMIILSAIGIATLVAMNYKPHITRVRICETRYL